MWLLLGRIIFLKIQRALNTKDCLTNEMMRKPSERETDSLTKSDLKTAASKAEEQVFVNISNMGLA